MITTTLNRIREHQPCRQGWEKLLAHLGKTKADDEPLAFATILESNGIDDALWCCCVEPQYANEWRLYAVWCAQQAQHLMTDQRSLHALDVADRYADGDASAPARASARAATRGEARAAAEYAARALARAAAWGKARGAAWAAAWDAAWDAAEDAQVEEFLRIITETEARK